MNTIMSAVMIALTTLFSCGQKSSTTLTITKNNNTTMSNIPTTGTDTAIFANGCFWCTEAIFEELDGVISAVSGYTGGHVKNPTYKEVCTGQTGHAECLQIVYDPQKSALMNCLEVFWETHDPTTLNQPGH